MRAFLAAATLVATAALRPLITPKQFGAHDLGGPRVVPAEGGGYTLWYHYRPLEDAANPELPPLSTGRVARATSEDGLEFTPRADGLGAGGSTLSANTDDWFWFDSGHVGCGDVVSGGDAFFLYYYGGSNCAMSLRDLGMDHDGDVYGMDLKCGVAVSQDGVRFGRLEGSEADGSLLTPDPDSWERKGAPYGWPAVCEDPQNDATLMFYTATEKTSGKACLGVARSPNGVTFARASRAPALEPGPPGAWDAGGIRRVAVLPRDGGILMLYEATDEAGVHAIGRATSADGVAWERDAEPVFRPGPPGAWDCGAVSSPGLLPIDGGLRMYYAARGEGKTMSIGAAESSDDGRTWKRIPE